MTATVNIRGTQGPKGDQGLRGEKGEKGEKGDAGPKGDAGQGITLNVTHTANPSQTVTTNQVDLTDVNCIQVDLTDVNTKLDQLLAHFSSFPQPQPEPELETGPEISRDEALQTLAYEAKSYDLLRNGTAPYTPQASSEFNNDFALSNAITVTNFIDQFSTNGDGENLEVTFNFDDYVIVRRIVMRQRMMSNNSSLMSKVEIDLGNRFKQEKVVLIEEDQGLSYVYKKHHSNDSFNDWGVQKAFEVVYKDMPVTKFLSIKALEIVDPSGDVYKNTGFSDIQVYGTKYVDPGGQQRVVYEENPLNVLNSWPAATFNSTVGAYNYPDTVNVLVANPFAGSVSEKTRYPPNGEVCAAFRVVLVDVISGVCGLPVPANIDIENGETWISLYLDWKANVLSGLSGTDLTVSTHLSNMLEILMKIYSIEVALSAGLDGGIGTKWIGTVIFEPDVSGIPMTHGNMGYPGKSLYKLFEDTVDEITGLLQNTDLSSNCLTQLRNQLGPPFYDDWTPMKEQLLALHVQTILSLALWTGLTDATVAAAGSVVSANIMYSNSTLALEDIQFVFKSTTTNIGTPLVDDLLWLGISEIDGYRLCSTAKAMYADMKLMMLGSQSFADSPRGITILRKISELLVTEMQIVEDFVAKEDTFYTLTAKKLWQDSLACMIALGMSSVGNAATVTNAGFGTLLTRVQAASIAHYLAYIYIFHLDIINKKLGLGNEPFFMYGALWNGFPEILQSWEMFSDPSVTVDGMGTDIERIPESQYNSTTDGRYIHWSETTSAGPLTTFANTEVYGILTLHEFNKSYVELNFDASFSMFPKPEDWGFLTEEFTVTLNLTERIDIDASGNHVHRNFEFIKQEIVATMPDLSGATDASFEAVIFQQALLMDPSATGTATHATLNYDNPENYLLRYKKGGFPLFKGTEIEANETIVWEIVYCTTAGDANTAYTSVVSGIVENGVYVPNLYMWTSVQGHPVSGNRHLLKMSEKIE